jgi:hypothetical protein
LTYVLCNDGIAAATELLAQGDPEVMAEKPSVYDGVAYVTDCISKLEFLLSQGYDLSAPTRSFTVLERAAYDYTDDDLFSWLLPYYRERLKGADFFHTVLSDLLTGDNRGDKLRLFLEETAAFDMEITEEDFEAACGILGNYRGLEILLERYSLPKADFDHLFARHAPFAQDERVLSVLLAHGADLNAQDENGNTALMNSLNYGRYENAKFLLEAGADVTIKNHKGQTAQALARKLRFPLAQKLLADAAATAKGGQK